jgi:multidrug efflux pump
MLLLLLLTIGLNVYLYIAIPKGFFPQQDTGELMGFVRADQNTSFQTMKQKLLEATAIVQKDPAVDRVTGFTGGGFGGTASANVIVGLKPLSERKESADQVIARLRPQLSRIQGAQAFMQSMQDIRIGGRQSNSQYQYTLQGDDLTELRSWSDKLRLALQDVPEVTDVDTDQQPGGLEQRVIVDRDVASRLGLTQSQIDNTLYDAFGQRQVSTIFRPLNQYKVVMEVAPQYWQDPETLRDIFVSTSGGPVSGSAATNAVAGTASVAAQKTRSRAAASSASSNNAASVASDAARNLATNQLANSGRGGASSAAAVSSRQETMVPLASFAHFETGTTPTMVSHQGTSVATTIAFNLPVGESLSTAVAAIDRATNRIGMPATIHGGFQASARSFQQSLAKEPYLILASLVAVYIVLGILYESLIHPITIISTLPSAGVGALLALMATGNEFSLIAFIGILLLIGIVKKNGIMMVDFAIEGERTLGLTPEAAIMRACLLRFRPIMMTTFAAILGALPLALAAGDGTELRRPLGIAIVGGLLLSQLLTLFTTPVVYLYIEKLRSWRTRRNPARAVGRFAGGPSHVGAE